jgi:hypothetical protein
MIEKTVISYLTDKTSAGKKVYAERPKAPPDKYILVEKTGSSTTNMITTSTIVVQSVCDSMCKKTLLNAMELNEEVKEVMSGIETEDSIVLCGLNSDYNFTDDSTREYRYQAVFQITHY